MEENKKSLEEQLAQSKEENQDLKNRNRKSKSNNY